MRRDDTQRPLNVFKRLADSLGQSLLREGLSDQGDYITEPVDTYVPQDPKHYDKFYSDDSYIVAAALQLHPLLDDDTRTKILNEVYRAGQKPYSAGAKSLEYGDPKTEQSEGDLPAGLHLITSGQMRLFAITAKGTPQESCREITQYRPGQWFGFPQLLWRARKFLDFRVNVPETDWPVFQEVTLQAVVSPGVEFRTYCLSENWALNLLVQSECFHRFAREQFLIRFARREEIIGHFLSNPVLKLLEPKHREYLMQLGAIRRVSPRKKGITYLPSGEPSFRTALILNGTAHAHQPGTPPRLVAMWGPGDLIGHEAVTQAQVELEQAAPEGVLGAPAPLVWEEQYEQLIRAETLLPPDTKPQFYLREPSRLTEVTLSSDTELLEFNWYALRWTLDDNGPLWNQAQRVLSPQAQTVTPLPRVVCVQESSTGADLAADLLAYGLAAALALDTSSTVLVIDSQGEKGLAARCPGVVFGGPELTSVCEARQRRAGPRCNEQAINYKRLQAPIAVGAGSVEIICPADPSEGKLELLVQFARSRPGVSYIVVLTRLQGTPWDGAVRGLALNLNGQSHEVFLVTDNADAKYDITADCTEPLSLTWVYRMTSRYLARERNRAERERVAWALGNTCIGKGSPPDSRSPRRQVRIPEDDSSFAEFTRVLRRAIVQSSQPDASGPLLAFLGEEPHAATSGQGIPLPESLRPQSLSTLARAFRRMARVVERRTVGLALSGGGAWGFAHVALIQHLEMSGVPIDYITGSSIGAILGAFYASGGWGALDSMVRDNAASSWLKAVTRDSLTLAFHLSSFTSYALERYVDEYLRKWSGTDAVPCLTTTEIPFFPVGTDLATHEPVFNLRMNIGWGVRMSSSFVPMVSSLAVGQHEIVDGAYSHNVPCKVAREVGADFVIASNVVPTSPPPFSIGLEAKLPLFVKKSLRLLTHRMDDWVRANYVAGYTAGEEEAENSANYHLHLAPQGVWLFALWKGPEIIKNTQPSLHDAEKRRGSILRTWSKHNAPGRNYHEK
jgi:predicted acylesterase/phospholipase RssA